MPRLRRPTMTQEGSRPGQGLRKSASSTAVMGSIDSFGLKDSSSSSEENNAEASPRGGVRFNRMVKSISLSPVKQPRQPATVPLRRDKMEDAPLKVERAVTRASIKAKLLPENQDDVFVDQTPADDPQQHDSNDQTDDWSDSPRHVGGAYERQLLRETDPSSIDAQGIYPPTACIFVANLTQTIKDETLEAEVTRNFSQFGTVFVKIRRDSRQMPFAFCQFTTEDDAKTAVQDGKGIRIFGRECRTEKAKANSVFIVYKRSSEAISTEEAASLLSPLGAISSVTLLDSAVQTEMDLPPSAVVYFKMYDSKRDVLRAVRSQRKLVVLPYEPKNPGDRSPHHSIHRTPFDSQAQNQMQRYEVDRRSAYVGNLPPDMTEDEMLELAGKHGLVRKVTINRKPILGGSAETVFAFIEYTRPDSVDDFVASYDGVDLRGLVLRAQRKQSRSFDSPQHYNNHGSPQVAGPPGSWGKRYTPTRPGFSGPMADKRHAASYRQSPRGPYGMPPHNQKEGSHDPALVAMPGNYAALSSAPDGTFGSPVTRSFTDTKTPRVPKKTLSPPQSIPERVSSFRGTSTKFSHSSSPTPRTGSVKARVTTDSETSGKETNAEKSKTPSQNRGRKERNTDSGTRPEQQSMMANNTTPEAVARSVEHSSIDASGDDKKAETTKTVATATQQAPNFVSASENVEEYDADTEAEKKPKISGKDSGQKFLPPPGPPPPGPLPPLPGHQHVAPPYQMPYGYMPPQMPPYGPHMSYGMPSFQGQYPPAFGSGYMGYSPGFVWQDAFGNPMYTGMTPPMTGPLPRPEFPPTPIHAHGRHSRDTRETIEKYEDIELREAIEASPEADTEMAEPKASPSGEEKHDKDDEDE